MKNIILVGIMGCGKTTISKLLSEKLKMPVIDMDEYLEKKYQCTIPDMFAISEEYFRDRESEACLDMAKLDGYIISTGGGVVKRKENRDILKQAGTVFYIDRPLDNIVSDVETAHRPLLKDGPQKLYQLYDERHELYLDSCHYHVDNDGTLDDIVNKIVEDIIENMNAIIEKRAGKYDYEIADVYQSSVTSHLQKDGVHPDSQGQQIIADLVCKEYEK